MSFHYRREAGEKGKLHRKNGVGLGLTLDNLIRADILSIGAAIQMLSYIADALTDAHKNDHCHGDISLDDIKIDAYGAVLVNGFGRPRSSTSAPERTPRGGSTDIYGLGVILLATLSQEATFQPPFERDAHDAAIVKKMISLDWRELSEESWLIKIQEFLIMALSLDPEERPSALDVANVLSGVLQNTNGPFLAEIISENSGLFDVEEEYGDAEILDSGVSELEPISLIPDSSQGAATGLWPREKILEMLMAEEESEEEPERGEWKPNVPSNESFDEDEPTVPNRTPIKIKQSEGFGNSTFKDINFDPSEIPSEKWTKESGHTGLNIGNDFETADDFPTDQAPIETDPYVTQTSDTFPKPELTEPTQPKSPPPIQQKKPPHLGIGIGAGGQNPPPPIVKKDTAHNKRQSPKPPIPPQAKPQERRSVKAPKVETVAQHQPSNIHQKATHTQQISHGNRPGQNNTKVLKIVLFIGLGFFFVIGGLVVGWMLSDSKKDVQKTTIDQQSESKKIKPKRKTNISDEDDTSEDEESSEEKNTVEKSTRPKRTKNKNKDNNKKGKRNTSRTTKKDSGQKGKTEQIQSIEKYRVSVKLDRLTGYIRCTDDGSSTRFQNSFTKMFNSRYTCYIHCDDGTAGKFEVSPNKKNLTCKSDGVKVKCW